MGAAHSSDGGYRENDRLSAGLAVARAALAAPARIAVAKPELSFGVLGGTQDVGRSTITIL